MIKNLKPNQHLMRCRNCPGVCIVFQATMKSKTPEKTKARRKLIRSQTHQAFSTINEFSVRKRDYAVCQRCALSFCINCNHPPHEDSACIVDTDDLADDDQPKPIRSKKCKARSNLKRLVL